MEILHPYRKKYSQIQFSLEIPITIAITNTLITVYIHHICAVGACLGRPLFMQ